MQRLICEQCGMAFDADAERQHREWHVDQRMKRLVAMSDTELLHGMNAALNKLRANAADVVALPYWLPSDRRDAEDGR